MGSLQLVLNSARVMSKDSLYIFIRYNRINVDVRSIGVKLTLVAEEHVFSVTRIIPFYMNRMLRRYPMNLSDAHKSVIIKDCTYMFCLYSKGLGYE